MLKFPLTFVLAFALVGLPSAPVAGLAPGTGGAACADNNMCYGGYGNDGTGCVSEPGGGGSSPADEFCDYMAGLSNTGLLTSFIAAGIVLMPGGHIAGTFALLFSLGTMAYAEIMMRQQGCK